MPELTLRQYAERHALPPFRLKQIGKWVLQRGVLDFNAMSDLPQDLRVSLSEHVRLLTVTEFKRHDSADGQTSKVLLRLADNKITEMVIIRHQKGRITLCISSQVGCPVGCSFCATGKMGFARHLSTDEIVDQVVLARSILITENPQRENNHVPTNIVFMGMGEPFLNYDAVMAAAEQIHTRLQLGGRRVTVSTSGVVPRIIDFADADRQVNLAVSLHAATDALRDELVPLNKSYSLDELGKAIAYYMEKSNRKVFFEYVMLEKVNDVPEQAENMVLWFQKYLPKHLVHVNLIPYNRVEGLSYVCSNIDDVRAFQRILEDAGYPVTVRFNMGNDIGAACGQLASKEAQVHVKKRLRDRLRQPEA